MKTIDFNLMLEYIQKFKTQIDWWGIKKNNPDYINQRLRKAIDEDKPIPDDDYDVYIKVKKGVLVH